jgi:hypothetical protein
MMKMYCISRKIHVEVKKQDEYNNDRLVDREVLNIRSTLAELTTIQTENFGIPFSNFELKSQGPLQSFWT